MNGIAWRSLNFSELQTHGPAGRAMRQNSDRSRRRLIDIRSAAGRCQQAEPDQLESRSITERDFPPGGAGYVGAHRLRRSGAAVDRGPDERPHRLLPVRLPCPASTNLPDCGASASARCGSSPPRSRYWRLTLHISFAPGTVLYRTTGDDRHETRDRHWLRACACRLRDYAVIILSGRLRRRQCRRSSCPAG